MRERGGSKLVELCPCELGCLCLVQGFSLPLQCGRVTGVGVLAGDAVERASDGAKGRGGAKGLNIRGS